MHGHRELPWRLARPCSTTRARAARATPFATVTAHTHPAQVGGSPRRGRSGASPAKSPADKPAKATAAEAETSPAHSLRSRAADQNSPAKSPKPPKQLFADK